MVMSEHGLFAGSQAADLKQIISGLPGPERLCLRLQLGQEVFRQAVVRNRLERAVILGLIPALNESLDRHRATC
jgi:hypothetical protein